MATAPSAAATTATFPSMAGLCTLCGEPGEFRFGDERSVRESYPCPHCRFTLRWRDQASLILDEFGDGQTLSLKDLVRSGRLDATAIYEPALRGPFVRHFRDLPKYTRSYFWPERRRGVVDPNGVRNEDLTQLTFHDDSFDLVITSDVMEHLRDIDLAFAEIHRVLKPGGVHIFSIPTHFPLPDRTVARVVVKDGAEINVLPAVYHKAGDDTPCLVYHDYGADLPARIDRNGSRTRIVRRTGSIEPCVRNATFITRKLAPADAAPKATTEAGRIADPRGVPSVECPICGSTAFESFNGRPNARCAKCRSVERHRLMWMVIQHFGLFREGLRVFHVAPEIALAQRFEKLLGPAYYPCDLDVAKYRTSLRAPRKIDLCTDLEEFADNSFDVIIHSHVLEHVTCDVAGVMAQMQRMLAADGHHLFSVPVRGEHTVEDTSDELTAAERVERFGQFDHMRLFGRTSLTQMLTQLWGEGRYVLDPVQLFGAATLTRHVIPEVAWTGQPNNHGIFYNRAPQPAAIDEPEAASAVPSISTASGRSQHGGSALAISTLSTGLASHTTATRRLDTAAWILRNLAPVAAYPRLVDLGAGPCRFAKLAHAMGYAVTAVDGRVERVPDDLEGVVFRQDDVRTTDIDVEVVLVIGLFYHLEAADQLALLRRCPDLAVVVVDTQICFEDIPGLGDFLDDRVSFTHHGVLGRYDGMYYSEKSTAMAAIGNRESFVPTEDSLLRMMEDTGFRSVMLVDPVYYSPLGARRWYVARKAE